MPIIPLSNLGGIGIIHDIPAYDLPPEAFTAGNNIRFKDNRVHKMLGQAAIYGTPTIAPYHIVNVPMPTDNFWVMAGLAKVYVDSGGTDYNITRQTAAVDVDYNATATDKWTSVVMNGIAFLNNGVDNPQQWAPPGTGTKLADLSNWPASTTCKALRSYLNFLIALDVTESGTRYPQVLRWSHPAAPGAVPSSWDYTDATKDARRVAVSQTPGFLVDCAPLGNMNVVYKEDSMYIMQYTGGSFVFSIRPLPHTVGLLARNCIAQIPQRHAFISQDDILVFDGSTIQSILDRRRRTTLFSTIDTANKGRSFAITNYPKHEVWFCYPETGYDQPNRALVWNWDTGALGDRSLGVPCAHANTGVVVYSGLTTDWTVGGTWADDAADIWDQRNYDPANTNIVLAMPSPAALYHADQTNQFAGVNMTAYVERQSLSIVGRDRQGNWKVDFNAVKYLRRVIPKIKASGSVDFYFGSQFQKEEAVTWSGPYSFNPATDYEILTDVVGKFISFKVQSGTDVLWELEGMDLDLELVGGY